MQVLAFVLAVFKICEICTFGCRFSLVYSVHFSGRRVSVSESNKGQISEDTCMNQCARLVDTSGGPGSVSMVSKKGLEIVCIASCFSLSP